jgi:hypothetical protein
MAASVSLPQIWGSSGLLGTDSQPGLAIADNSTLGGWWLVKTPNGNIGLVKQTATAPGGGNKFSFTSGLASMFGYKPANLPSAGQSYGVYVGQSTAAPTFGTNLGKAAVALGANATQQAGLMQSVDVGAIFKGKNAVVQPANQAPGTTLPQAGQSSSGSEAVPSNIIPSPDLSGLGSVFSNIWGQIQNDAKYSAVMVGCVLLGAILMFRAFSGGGGGGGRVIPIP